MKTIFFFFLFTICSFAQGNSSPGDVANAELAFSKFAVEHGIKESFLAYLDSGSIIFRPYPVNGKQWYQDHPSSKGFLSWYPVRVEVAVSGDFAYSTGPWEFRKEKLNDDPVAYGHYFSIWKKNNAGEWKVLLDVGNSYDKTDKRIEEVKFIPSKQSLVSKNQSQESIRLELFNAEKLFDFDAGRNNFSSSFQKHACDDVRVYREGKFPVEGKHASSNFLISDTLQHSYQINDGHVASSGDLGFTYGLSISAKKDTNNFVRVWRKEKEWRIVVDILSPVK